MPTDPKEEVCEVCGRTVGDPPRNQDDCARAFVQSIYGGGPQVADCFRRGYERLLKERQPPAGPSEASALPGMEALLREARDWLEEHPPECQCDSGPVESAVCPYHDFRGLCICIDAALARLAAPTGQQEAGAAPAKDWVSQQWRDPEVRAHAFEQAMDEAYEALRTAMMTVECWSVFPPGHALAGKELEWHRLAVDALASREAVKSLEAMRPASDRIATAAAPPSAPQEGLFKEGLAAIDTLKSLSVMLGWMNVPPREVLERSINALKARALPLPEKPAGDTK